MISPKNKSGDVVLREGREMSWEKDQRRILENRE
jgi:hypothetical protein